MMTNTAHSSGFESNRDGADLDLDFSFAFQPIVEGRTLEATGYEALIRGVSGERAGAIIARIQPHNLSAFDQSSRNRAIEVASRIGFDADLHLNCSEAGSTNLDQLLHATAGAAARHRFPAERIVLEFRNLDKLGGPRELATVRDRAAAAGLRVAADNVGCGEIGLKRLVVFRPHQAKLDRELITAIHTSPRRQAMVAGLIAACRSIGIVLVATGVENELEYEWLAEAGVERFQGYFFARPGLETAPEVVRSQAA